jgi:hypothetical protein
MSVGACSPLATVTDRAPHYITCPHKMPYPSQEYAHAVALLMEYRYGEDFHEYRCNACSFWHIGHAQPRPRKLTHRPEPTEERP